MNNDNGRPPLGKEGTGHTDNLVLQHPPSSVAAGTDGSGTELDVLRAQVQQLIQLLDAQRGAEQAAYEHGWNTALDAAATYMADVWIAGYAAAEVDMHSLWAETARRVRTNASPDARSWDERRRAEMAALKPRPGDFPGLDNDPHCLEPMRASIESIVRTNRRAA